MNKEHTGKDKVIPVVSVIIPNYNHAPYLKQRIDSVLSQTYQDFEVIILDDRSTDNSREIIGDYKDHPKVSHIVMNEVNGGNTFKQWEKGIDLAAGKYIWIAESDDWADSRFLESLMPSFYKNNKTGIAFCDSLWIDGDGKTVKDITRMESFDSMPGSDFITRTMLTGNSIYNASMVIFDKEVYKNAVTGEYKKYKYCGDWLIWVQILAASEVFYTNKKLNHFRRHTGSVSFKSEKEGLFFLEGLQIQFYIKNYLKPARKYINKTANYWSRLLLHRWVSERKISSTTGVKIVLLLIKYDYFMLIRLPVIVVFFLGRSLGSSLKRIARS